MKLTVKITLGIIVLSLAVAGIAGFAVFMFTKQTLEDAIATEQEVILEGVMRSIDRTLYERVLNIQSIAASDVIKKELSLHSRIMEEEDRDEVRHEEEHSSVIAELTELTFLTGPWDVLEMLDTHGFQTHSTLLKEREEEEHKKDASENAAFQQAIQGEVYVSDAVISRDTGKPTVVFAAPVRDTESSGRHVVGVVMGHFAWPVITEILESVGYNARLYTKDGMLIGTSVRKERVDALKRSDAGHPLLAPAFQGKNGSAAGRDISGTQDVLSSFTSQQGFLSYTGSGWILAVDAPQEIILAPAKKQAMAVAAITVGLLGLLAVATLTFITVFVTKPLNEFSSTVGKIRQGDIAKRIAIRSKDEIGQLARSFNEMLDRLTVEEGIRQQIIDVLPGALFLTDKKGNIERINPAAEFLFGYSQKELVGKSVSKIFNIGLDELREKEAIRGKAIAMSVKSGADIPVMLYGRMIDVNKGDKRAVLVALDRRKEKKYVETRLASIVPILQNVAVGDLTKTFSIPETEDEFTELLVALNLMIDDIREAQDQEQKRYRELVHRTRELELKTEVLQDTKKALSETFDSLDEEQTKMKQIDAELKKKVTELGRFNRDLQAEKQETSKFKQAVDAATDGIFMASPDLEIIYCNTACEKINGYSRQEVLGQYFDKFLVSEKTKKEVMGKLQDAMRRGKAFHTEEVIVRRKDGLSVQIELSIFPIVENNAVRFFVGLLQDITKRKEVSRMESEFISTASHQLRTPMTGIQWVVERFLKKEKVTKRGAGYLSDIHTSIKRLTSLVDLLLNVSRIEGGHVGIAPKKLDAMAFVRGYIGECAPLCAKKSLACTVSKTPKKLLMVTDESALRNIIQSLVSNALEYTPEHGSVEVMVEKKQNSVLFAVKDSGIGIPRAEQATIFEKFTRAENAKLVKTDGTGLGLYIAKQSSELLGGKIWFESEENKGTVFFVELPLKSKEKSGGKPLA